MIEPRHVAEPNGFRATSSGKPGYVPEKNGYRRRMQPELELRLNGYYLSLATLRSIAADLERQGQAAGCERRFRDRDTFSDAVDEVARFISDRQRFEGRAWR